MEETRREILQEARGEDKGNIKQSSSHETISQELGEVASDRSDGEPGGAPLTLWVRMTHSYFPCFQDEFTNPHSAVQNTTKTSSPSDLLKGRFRQMYGQGLYPDASVQKLFQPRVSFSEFQPAMSHLACF